MVLGRRLALENGGFGMVGTVPIHLLHEDAGEKVPSFDELLIDVGAADKHTAETMAPVGSFAYFSESYIAFGDGKICAKALDDRIGCMLMIELLHSELEADTWFCFQVQEEVGLRGAACTGSRVQPDRVLVLEATTAADLDGVTGDKRVCVLGDGPVVSFMDGATIYDRALYRMARETADKNGIPNQTKTAIAGGNDAGALQRAGQGSAALAVSLPCRYIHSGASVVQQSDIDATRALLAAFCPNYMIEYQQNLDLLRQYEQTDLFSVRVLALAESYGCDYNFARFYVQRTESGQMTAVLSYLDRDCTLSLTKNADREELTAFFAAMGYVRCFVQRIFAWIGLTERGR